MSLILMFILCVALVGVDQLIKFFVIEYLKPIEYINVIDNVLRFRYVENSGAVFGSFATHTAILTIFSILLLLVTIVYLIRNKNQSKFINFCLLLMISGGFGNIIDRIRLQYVVDYIEPLFVNFAVFNFADCLITVGAFLLVGYLIYDLFQDNKNKNDSSFSEEAYVRCSCCQDEEDNKNLKSSDKNNEDNSVVKNV